MEISERELRQLARDVDEQHRDGMASMANDIRELHAETRILRTATTRRSALKRAAAGAGVLTVGGVVLPISKLLPAAAQEQQEPSDEELAAFAEGIELAAVDAYEAAVATGLLSAPLVQAATLFASHHQEHAKALAAQAGSAAEGKANAMVLRVIADQLRNSSDEDGVVQIAYDLENSAASTYLFALGALDSAEGMQLAASILPVEAQHAVVLGMAMGKPLSVENNDALSVVPTFETQAKAIDPAKFPTTTTTTTTTTTK